MSVLSIRKCLSNLKSVALTILKLLAFNPQKFRGHVTLTTPLYWKKILGHVRIVPDKLCVKFEVCSFNHLKLLAFNPPKFRGNVTLTTLPFWKIFGGHVRIVPKNICTKLEDWNFNRFEAIVCFRLTDNALHPW